MSSIEQRVRTVLARIERTVDPIRNSERARVAVRRGVGRCARGSRVGSASRCGRRGAALLEIVLAMGILMLGMAMLGGTFRNTDFTARRAVDKARALMLAEQIITYVDTDQFRDQLEVNGKFEDQAPPGWGWDVKREKDSTVEGLERVTVRILSDDPETEEDEPVPVFIAHYLRAEKKNINLQQDFGLTTEQLDQLTAAVPGGTALFDPLDFDPTSFARMDMETLTQMLPVLLQSMGDAGGAGAMLAAGVGGGGGMPSVSPQQIQQLMNQMGNARGAGAGSVGGSPGGSGGSPATPNSGASDGSSRAPRSPSTTGRGTRTRIGGTTPGGRG